MALKPRKFYLLWACACSLLLCLPASAEVIELHRFSAIVKKKYTILRAYEKGQTVRILGSYHLNKKYFKGDLELVLSQLNDLQKAINLKAKTLKESTDAKVGGIKDTQTSLHMGTITTNKTNTDRLYNLVVNQGNTKLHHTQALEGFRRKNRVLLSYKEAAKVRWIERLTVVRNGHKLRDQPIDFRADL